MPAQTKNKNRFADLKNNDGKDSYADIQLNFDDVVETDNDRDNEFDLELDIHKSTQNLKLGKALNFYNTAKDKNAVVDSLTDDLLNLLLGDEFKSENLKLIDKNFASTYDTKYLQSIK